jgi:hypothetical protein
MSGEAPRVELNSTDLDFDLTSPVNQKLSQMHSDAAPLPNGDAEHNLQNGAVKTKDGLLESRVSGTERPRPFAETQANAIHGSLICGPHHTRIPKLTHTKQLQTPSTPQATTPACRT